MPRANLFRDMRLSGRSASGLSPDGDTAVHGGRQKRGSGYLTFGGRQLFHSTTIGAAMKIEE